MAATDANGDLLWREEYTPFGRPHISETNTVGEEGFTGHIFDGQGMVHMKARTYMTTSYRFTTPDPVTFLSSGLDPAYFNRYAYVHNDPVNMVDPDGRCAQGSALRYITPGVCFTLDYHRGLHRGLGNQAASIGHALASRGLLGQGAATRANVVNLGIDAAHRIFQNNAGEVAEFLAHNTINQPIGQNIGTAVGNAAPAILTRGAGRGVQASFGAANFVSGQLGGGIRALNGVLDQAASAGIDTSAFSNETLGNVVLAGASGAKVNFNSENGAISATFTSSRAGSRIKTRTTIEICKTGDDGSC